MQQPGYPNPLVTLSVFDLASYLSSRSAGSDDSVASHTYSLTFSNPFPPTQQIISEVAWVHEDDDEADLMVKASDRGGQIVRVAHFRLGREALQTARALKRQEAPSTSADKTTIVGEVVRTEDYAARDGGWAEVGQHIRGIDAAGESKIAEGGQRRYPRGYVDVVPDEHGYNHLALFSPPNASQPVFLSSSEPFSPEGAKTGGKGVRWEIDGGVKALDFQRGLV